MKAIDYNFCKNAQAKEMAVKYFPDFFGQDLNVTTEYGLDDLEKVYMEYCKEYFTRYSRKYNIERFGIQMAYDYMKMILKEHTKFEANSKLANSILQSYDELTSTISSYSFYPRWDKSYGAFQNKTNEKILFEISLFHPVLISVLKNVDNYFETISEPSKIGEFYCELISKLEELGKTLNNSNEELMNAQHKYHDTWDEINRSWYYNYCKGRVIDSCIESKSESELGSTKKEWRLARNRACHSILNFFRELENINIALYYNTFKFEKHNYGIDDNTLEISKLYNNCAKYIAKSPNYFCYLNENEKEELAQQKILRKIQSKKNF